MPVAYRLAAWDTPAWVGANPEGGRFNHPAAGPTQYWSLHPLTPWAEHLRREGIDDQLGLHDLRHRIWAGRVEEGGLLEVTFDRASQAGIGPEELVDDDWGACQDWAGRLRRQGVPGIVVPSAALPGTRNLVLFGARVVAPYLPDPVDPEVDLPAAPAAERATTLSTLLPLVRYRGRPHAELEAWRAGRPYAFSEPPVPR